MEEQRTAAVASVANSFIDLLRTVRKAKARMLAAAGDDVESATHVLLHTVASPRARCGPARSPSTCSPTCRPSAGRSPRWWPAGCSSAGPTRRDGRASLLVLTAGGPGRGRRARARPAAFFAQMLDGWAADELRQFAGCSTGSPPPTTTFTPPGSPSDAARVHASRHPHGRHHR